MRILVTGATGFIGSHVAEELLRRKHDVTLLTRSMSISEDPDMNHRWIRGDLLGPDFPDFASQEIIVHCAGEFGIAGEWRRCLNSLVLGTKNALSLANKAGVKRFVHISSLAVCNPPGPQEWLDETSPCSRMPPVWNWYARAKIESETAVRDAAKHGEMEVVIIRPGVTFGTRDRQAIPQLVRALEGPIRFRIGNGHNPVAWVAVEELAAAIGEAVARDGISGRCYPVAGNLQVTQNDLLGVCAKVLGVSMPSVSLPLPVAIAFAGSVENAYRATGRSHAPITRLGVWVLGTASRVCCNAAAEDLGWKGQESWVDVILRSLAWRDRK